MKTKDTLHYSKSIIYFRPIDLMLLFSLKKFLQKPVIQYRSDGVIQYLEAGKKGVLGQKLALWAIFFRSQFEWCR
jgi:hypothetical protein